MLCASLCHYQSHCRTHVALTENYEMNLVRTNDLQRTVWPNNIHNILNFNITKGNQQNDNTDQCTNAQTHMRKMTTIYFVDNLNVDLGNVNI